MDCIFVSEGVKCVKCNFPPHLLLFLALEKLLWVPPLSFFFFFSYSFKANVQVNEVYHFNALWHVLQKRPGTWFSSYLHQWGQELNAEASEGVEQCHRNCLHHSKGISVVPWEILTAGLMLEETLPVNWLEVQYLNIIPAERMLKTWILTFMQAKKEIFQYL